MFTQGFAEVLIDILTVNPAIINIQSASAILDTSNYTFNAITLGKDAKGFKFHSHTVSSLNSGIYNNNYVLAKRYNSFSPSSYHSSGSHLQFSSSYVSVPNYPSIYDQRLERGSTLCNIGSGDLGHYVNAAIDSSYSSIWNVIGGYPPSGEVSKYLLLDSNESFVLSGNLSGVFNSKKIIDKLGFIKINENINVDSVSSGPYIISASNFNSDPQIIVGVKLEKGDAVSLALFGGVNHVGIWCLDLKYMLKSGLNPPYTWNYLNNNKKYKLVAKVTFWDDLLYNQDLGSTPGLALLDTNGILIRLKFNFK